MILAIVILLAAISPADYPGRYSVTVTAGAFDRMETVVSFPFPDKVEAGVYRMTAGKGTSIQVQVDRQNRGWFRLENLRAGSSRTYSLEIGSPSSEASGAGAVTHSIDHNTITIASKAGEVLSFYHGRNEPPETMDKMYRRGGYIHPVYSPEGVPLTNHLDQKMHPHHYGIWSAWTNTNFRGGTPDFWNVHDRSGRVNHVDSIETAWEGPVHGGFKAFNHFVDLSGPAPVVALNEEWEVTVYRTSGNGTYHMFDLVLTQTANTDQPLLLPKYHYGGLAFRGHEDWNNPENVSFLTSDGFSRDNGNATRARWSHMGGTVDGNRAGIAVLCHPGNFRAPQPVRIHPEIPYFVYAPMQLGDMAIEPGSPYVMRYRFITHDGEVDPEMLDRMWYDYAYPPGVTVIAQS